MSQQVGISGLLHAGLFSKLMGSVPVNLAHFAVDVAVVPMAVVIAPEAEVQLVIVQLVIHTLKACTIIQSTTTSYQK